MTPDDNWIEHHGKGYPDLPMDTLVQLKFRDGEFLESATCVGDWTLCWRHDDDSPCHADITHYHVVKP